ncbi:DUF1569 domain-containing protein [Silvibacterium dinghuense]|uniref:DUF1569 domain-containing protein n=1 Tax=Silvibacterium dinghuense TaxID=1560006 RepID=A0A4Q1SGD1_9BACT|nr:DUF1569 domain-containing protein [Silvibacterium dinghuense]RXS96397.1 DUF1569 domain-containing protein [Silvibacterium dinghuense]GGG90462.1 hypothetical protein GCM10011586_01110 [Silvibacterium dinghuense]
MDASFAWLTTQVEVRLGSLSAAECGMHAPSSGWSRQEVVEHLLLTYGETLALVEKYCARERATGRRSSLREHIVRRVVLGLGWMPRGVQAPVFVRPQSVLPEAGGRELCNRFRERLLQLDIGLTRGEAVFGDRVFAPHFMLGPMTARQWRRFHFVHGRHHLGQLDRITRALRG